MHRYLKFLFIIWLILPKLACADVNWLPEHSRLLFGVKSYIRDYREDLQKPMKSNEFGLLYGYQLGFERKDPNRWMYELLFNLDHGKTAYDGAYMNYFGEYRGPAKATTDNLFIEIDSNVGYSFVLSPKHIFTPFVGFRVHGWGRAVGQDYPEIYSISNAQIGAQYDYQCKPTLSLGIRTAVLPMLAGEMMLEEAMNPTVTLGDEVHYEVAFPIHFKFKDNSALRFTGFYRYQKFGQSNVARYDFDRVYREPASRNHVVGLKIDFLIGN